MAKSNIILGFIIVLFNNILSQKQISVYIHTALAYDQNEKTKGSEIGFSKRK